MRKSVVGALMTVGVLTLCEPHLANAAEKGGAGLVRQEFGVLPTFMERVGAAMEEMGRPKWEGEAKEFFSEVGVSWPEGSSLRHLPAMGRLIVVNTPENLARFEQVLSWLNVTRSQLEVEVQYVEFELADIDAIGKTGRVEQDALRSLWQKGRGKLLHAPKVVTQSGAEATVKGVREVIYPTEFTVAPVGTNTNTTVTAHETIVEPGAFETREAGVILQVLPEVTSDGGMINLTMTPQVVSEPEWKDYGGKYLDAKGKEQSVKMEVPFFHTQTVTTSISIKDGATVLLGGGMPSRDPTKVVYAFVSARRIGLDGKPLKSAATPLAK